MHGGVRPTHLDSVPHTRVQEALGIAAAACAQPALATAGAAAPRGRAGGAAQPGKPAAGRSSRFRGVTKHRRSGRWEAHCWGARSTSARCPPRRPALAPTRPSLRMAISRVRPRHVLCQAMRIFCLTDPVNSQRMR